MCLSRPFQCLILMMLFCLCNNYLQGQSVLIRQEQRALLSVKDSISLVNSLNRIGLLYRDKNADSCFYYGIKAKTLATRLDYPKGKTDADNVIALALFERGLYKESLELFNKVLVVYRQQSDTANVAQVIANMAFVYKYMGDKAKTKMLLSQAIQTGKKLKNDSVMSLIYSHYCFDPKLPDDSVRYYLEKSRKIASRYNDKRTLIELLQVQAQKLLNKGRRQEALPLIRQALTESRKERLEFTEMSSLGLYSSYYYYANKQDSALMYIDILYKLVLQKGYVYQQVNILKNMVTYAVLSGNKERIISAHSLLEAAIVAENDNLKQFIGDYIKYNAIQDDNARLGIINKSNRTKILLLISVCGISILLIIIIYRLYRVSRQHAQEQVAFNRQISEQNKALQEADEFKNKLVSILAHDFRSPLSSTISIARMMRNNHGFTEEEMELFYGDIEKDATKMLESFDTILQWIRQQLSGYQFKAETLEPYALFRESAALFGQQLEAKKIIFSNQIQEHMTVISDKEMLQFVNRNLLSNAIKFSPEGGRITVSCTKDATEFTVTVADDGPGMSETVLGKLFSITSQAGPSTQMGAGIALSMCRDFIKKLNGRIRAENKEPNGAVFYYTVPSANINS